MSLTANLPSHGGQKLVSIATMRRVPIGKGAMRTRWTLALLLSIAVVWQRHACHASSRSPRPPNSKRKKRTKRLTNKIRRGDDPHDHSSSSPSFLPLVFSENEREEGILSALARLEMDDSENELDEEVKEKPTMKKTKRKVKKAMASVKVERKGDVNKTQSTAEKQTKTADDSLVEVAQVDRSVAKETPGTKDSLLTIGNGGRQSVPRQKLVPPSSNVSQVYPPRPTWKRPAQNPPLHSRPQLTSGSPGAVPRSTVSPSMYQYPPPGTVSPPQAKHQRPQGDTSSSSSSSSTTVWTRKFLAARPKDTLLPIPREYMSDGFNLVHLAPIVERIARSDGGYVPPETIKGTSESFPLFKAALRLILSNDDEPTSPTISRAAEVLYTLVHARYVISPRGLDTVRRVLRRADGTIDPVFGRCPRIQCRGMPVLPCGDSDNYDPRNSLTTRAKRYCPSCGEKFFMWDSKVDESAWGPSFCHLFLMIYGHVVFPDLFVSRAENAAERNMTTAEPSIFGFRLHPMSQLRYSVRDS